MIIIPDNSLILVALMPSVKDFDIARMLGWYRIPLRSAPKIVDVDYLAFYQGANFGEEHRWRIEYMAKYYGHELTTRAELIRSDPDHPRANEEYYKIQLGEFVPLAAPICTDKWKRVTFLYSTGELLNRAETVNDLVVRSDDREILWKKLKERAEQSNLYQSKARDFPELDEALLQMISGLNSMSIDNDLEDY